MSIDSACGRRRRLYDIPRVSIIHSEGRLQTFLAAGVKQCYTHSGVPMGLFLQCFDTVGWAI